MAMNRMTERRRPRRAFLLPSRAFAQPTYGIGAMLAAALFVALATALYDRTPSGAARDAMAFGAAALSFAGVLTVLLAPTRVLIRRNGVSVAWLGLATFVPYAEIEAVETYGLDMVFGHGVPLSLRSGKLLRLTARLNVPFGDGGRSERVAGAIRERGRVLAAPTTEPRY
jgi:hypothetical protein